MNMSLRKSASVDYEKSLSSAQKQEKLNEVRMSLGSLSGKLSVYCSDASICRFLRARNWSVKKATLMLKEALKWRLDYKPEEIRWEDVALEGETGKIYRANYLDKQGRPVLVMRPACQNTKSTRGQIRYLVYCMENAILNLPALQEQMVWLIDFEGFNMSHVTVKVTRETANVLQNMYPERLGLAILYNPPKIFESFWKVVKPFLETKTYKKVKFVYTDDQNTKKIMEDLFDMDKLESSFGGNNQVVFNISEYSERMKEDDKKMFSFWTKETSDIASQPKGVSILDSLNLESDPEASSKDSSDNSPIPKDCKDNKLLENDMIETTENNIVLTEDVQSAVAVDPDASSKEHSDNLSPNDCKDKTLLENDLTEVTENNIVLTEDMKSVVAVKVPTADSY